MRKKRVYSSTSDYATPTPSHQTGLVYEFQRHWTRHRGDGVHDKLCDWVEGTFWDSTLPIVKIQSDLEWEKMPSAWGLSQPEKLISTELFIWTESEQSICHTPQWIISSAEIFICIIHNIPIFSNCLSEMILGRVEMQRESAFSCDTDT